MLSLLTSRLGSSENRQLLCNLNQDLLLSIWSVLHFIPLLV